mgnify:CR=1 FL=1
MVVMILADKIIQLRKQFGWSQENLADALNVSRQSVSKWESGNSIPDLTKILKMAEIFGVSTDYLLKDEIEKPDAQSPEGMQGGDNSHDPAISAVINEWHPDPAFAGPQLESQHQQQQQTQP